MVKKKYRTRFPMARIKKIMQTDEDVGKISQATPILISKALELFMQELLTDTANITTSKQSRTLSVSHLKQCVATIEKFDFLKDLVEAAPEREEPEKPERKQRRKKSKVDDADADADDDDADDDADEDDDADDDDDAEDDDDDDDDEPPRRRASGGRRGGSAGARGRGSSAARARGSGAAPTSRGRGRGRGGSAAPASTVTAIAAPAAPSAATSSTSTALSDAPSDSMVLEESYESARRSTSAPQGIAAAAPSPPTLSSSSGGLAVGSLPMPPGRFALPGSLAPLTNVDVSNLPLLPGPPSTAPLSASSDRASPTANSTTTSSSSSSSSSNNSTAKSQVDFLLN